MTTQSPGLDPDAMDQEVQPDRKLLSIPTLRFSSDTQPRAEIDEEYVERLAERMEAGPNGIVRDPNGDEFPPITVYYDGDNYWVADGHHRGRAARQSDVEKIQVELYRGDKRDAILYSTGANSTHGKRRTDEDRRRALNKLLFDDKWRQWSTSEIARQVDVSKSTVSRRRRKLADRYDEYELPDTVKYKDSSGEVSEMDVGPQRRQQSNGDSSSTEATRQKTHTPTPEEQSPSTGSADNESSGLNQDSSTVDIKGSEERANFMRDNPELVEGANELKRDIISDSLVMEGNFRTILRTGLTECEFFGEIDLVLTAGPDGEGKGAFKDWSDTFKFAEKLDAPVVALMRENTYPEVSGFAKRHYEHAGTQLVYSTQQEWWLASYWGDIEPPTDRIHSHYGQTSDWVEWSEEMFDDRSIESAVNPHSKDGTLLLGGYRAGVQIAVVTEDVSNVEYESGDERRHE